jgi:hypothetical protein
MSVTLPGKSCTHGREDARQLASEGRYKSQAYPAQKRFFSFQSHLIELVLLKYPDQAFRRHRYRLASVLSQPRQCAQQQVRRYKVMTLLLVFQVLRAKGGSHTDSELGVLVNGTART